LIVENNDEQMQQSTKLLHCRRGDAKVTNKCNNQLTTYTAEEEEGMNSIYRYKTRRQEVCCTDKVVSDQLHDEKGRYYESRCQTIRQHYYAYKQSANNHL